MRIEPYMKYPDNHGFVHPTLEEFCNSYYGEEPVIVHSSEYEDFNEETNCYELNDADRVFVHGNSLRPCAYLQKKYYMATVEEWRMYPDGIHVRITPWKET